MKKCNYCGKKSLNILFGLIGGKICGKCLNSFKNKKECFNCKSWGYKDNCYGEGDRHCGFHGDGMARCVGLEGINGRFKMRPPCERGFVMKCKRDGQVVKCGCCCVSCGEKLNITEPRGNR